MSRNDITGDKIATKPASQAFLDRWDAIFKPAPRCCDRVNQNCRQGRDCPLRAGECKWPVAEEGKENGKC